jgi:hypothetical protein
MRFECIATALNLRLEPRGAVVAELRSGDFFDVPTSKASAEWVLGTVVTGVSAGKKGYVRRKWIIQNFDVLPNLLTIDRTKAADIVSRRTNEYDDVRYKLGYKAKTWKDLKDKKYVDCSGWVFLIGKEIINTYSLKTSPDILYTYSGNYLKEELFQPGVLIGIDFAEYSWDRGRPLDIDHIAIVGSDNDGLFVSQSSSSGGGVNKVPLLKWLNSQAELMATGRVHLVDILAIP